MVPAKLSLKLGASPGRLAIVGVLAVVLAVVLWKQFGGEATGPRPTRARQDSARRPGSASPPVANVPPARRPSGNASPTVPLTRVSTVPRIWPEIPTEQMLAHDPFGLPAVLRRDPIEIANAVPDDRAGGGDPAIAQRVEAALQRLQASQHILVLEQQGQFVAMLGGRQIRVGDIIEGMLVREITQEGLVVQPLLHALPPAEEQPEEDQWELESQTSDTNPVNDATD